MKLISKSKGNGLIFIELLILKVRRLIFGFEVIINELIYGGRLPCNTQNRRIKYLNNIVEQDHRFIKRIIKPMLGFKSFKSAYFTISGIESMHMLRKKQVGQMTPFEEMEFIQHIMNVG